MPCVNTCIEKMIVMLIDTETAFINIPSCVSLWIYVNFVIARYRSRDSLFVSLVLFLFNSNYAIVYMPDVGVVGGHKLPNIFTPMSTLVILNNKESQKRIFGIF